MNVSFYTAAVGAQQQQARLNVHANNLANVNTQGFRGARPVFSALVYDSVASANDVRLSRGSGAYLSATETDFSPGVISQTGRAQDYAIAGEGFFALWDPANGSYSYTRDGSFTLCQWQQVNAEEQLENSWYLSDGQGRLVVGEDGRILAVTDQQESQPVGIFDFINTNGMQPVGEGQLLAVEKNQNLQVGSGKLVQGALESSNTDMTTEMTKMIEAQRSFSYALKMVQTADEIENTVINLR